MQGSVLPSDAELSRGVAVCVSARIERVELQLWTSSAGGKGMVLQLAGRTEPVQCCWGIGVQVVVDGGRCGDGCGVCIVMDGLDWNWIVLYPDRGLGGSVRRWLKLWGSIAVNQRRRSAERMRYDDCNLHLSESRLRGPRTILPVS